MQEQREADALAKLIEQGTIDERSSAYGVALKVISDGLASLDARQRRLYETEVAHLIRANVSKDDTAIPGDPSRYRT